MLIDVISDIVGIEIFEHVRRGAIRGHRTFLIAQDLSIEFVDESVHGCVRLLLAHATKMTFPFKRRVISAF